jgi:hypothetical protein
MRSNFLFRTLEGLFNNYKWSDISKIGEATYDEYISRLNPKQTKVSEDSKYKRIHWEDEQTLYVIRFTKQGKFLMIEREVWYEFSLPFFKKKIILDERKY